MGRNIHSGDVRPQQTDELTLSEIRDGEAVHIDVMSPRTAEEFRRLIEEENLTEEIVEVVVQKAPSSEKNPLTVVTPNVNGVNQPIVRGYPTKVKLKYVLALAQSKEMSMTQEEDRSGGETMFRSVFNTVQSWPFEVRRCSEKARALIEHTLAQPL